ncbi:MAG: MMPL family transporter [Deltaproteobacteria bacterium]|nr:MMPL family transporter [Deltaproteobacteria bacterium]
MMMQQFEGGIASLHTRFERGFETWGQWVCRFRWFVAVAILIPSVLLGSLVPQIVLDNSIEAALLSDDPARLAYDDFRARFGQDDRILVIVRSSEIFNVPFLQKLRAFHEDLEESAPHVEEVTSLINVRATYGRGDELVVEDLLETWPESDADLAQFESRVRNTPFYQNLYINADGTLTAIVLKPGVTQKSQLDEKDLDDFESGFDWEPGKASNAASEGYLSQAEEKEMIDGIHSVMARHESKDFPLAIAGETYTKARMNAIFIKDVPRAIAISVLANALFLFLLFRRLSAVFLPLLVVVASMFSTLGFMPLLGISGSSVIQIVPLLLVAVGICAALHLLALVYRERDKGETKFDSISKAMRHSGLAILMTSLTTAGGLLSFTTASIQGVSSIGVVAPIGVALVFVYTMTLLPAVLAIFPMPQRKGVAEITGETRLSRVLARIGDFSTGNPRCVLGAAALLALLSTIGILDLQASQNLLKWFPANDPVRVTTQILDREMGGSNTLEVVVDTGKVNGLYEPLILQRLEEATEFALSLEHETLRVAKVNSVIDVLKETHRALNGNDPAFYKLPEQKELIAQELLLFENSGSDDLEELVDSQFQLARMSILVPNVDGKHFPAFIEKLRSGLEEIFGEGTEIEITGIVSLLSRSYEAVYQSVQNSYILALAIITPLMILLIGNWRLGLLTMVPNLLPIYITMGFMGWVGIPLDQSTMVTGCIIIGLAVDDTIHFMHKYQRYFAINGDVREATRRTLTTTGTALFATTVVLTAGFACNGFAYMVNGKQFGAIAAFATVVAFVMDVVVMPALLMVSTRKQ